MGEKRSINVWYVCGLSLCNFDCAYCASGSPARGDGRTNDREWFSKDDPERYKQTLDWLSRQPYQIGLRLQTIGEPFVSWDFLKGAVAISESPNIRFVELVTNGSLLRRRLPRLIRDYKADPAKFSLWVTYHHTEISPEELLNQVSFARELGVEVMVNALVFPDNLNQLRQLAQLCSEKKIPLSIDIGHNHNQAYGDSPFFTVLDDRRVVGVVRELNADAQAQLTAITAAEAPGGLQCSAGYDYVHITPNGDVYPCRTYQYGGAKTFLGSVRDERFDLKLRASEFAACRVKSGCICKEDYLHLQIARSPRQERRSLGGGYPGVVPDTEKQKMQRVLQKVQKTGLVRVLNAMVG